MPTPSYLSRILAGTVHLSVVTTAIGPVDLSQDMHPATTLIHTSKVFQPGRTNDELGISCYLESDTSANSIWNTLKALVGSAGGAAFTVGLDGFAAGSSAWLGSQCVAKLALKTPNDGLVTLDVTLASRAQGLFGVCLTPLQTITVTTTGATVDAGAATSNGAIATLHVPTITGSPTFTAKVQDSADGSSWADVAGLTFASLTTTPSSQHLAITGTVRRYRRAVCTVTGGASPSVQCLVALAAS